MLTHFIKSTSSMIPIINRYTPPIVSIISKRVDYKDINQYIQSKVDQSKRLDSLNINLTSGQLLCSSLLPETFWYNKSGVKIVNGILINGTLKKSVLGNSHGSIIQSLFKFYGKTITANFISDAKTK